MNRINKAMRKGFTLVELMVVMSIMSILLVAVMSMTTPASRIFKRTAVSDNVYSAADNITGYLQRTLEYADNIWIMDSATLNSEFGDTQKAANAFKNCYYNSVIKGISTTDWKYVGGKIRVVQLSNSDGQIYETTYSYSDSSSTAMPSAGLDDTNVKVLNQNYFKGDYADYYFRYALGASMLEAADDGSGGRKMSGTEIIYNLKAEKDGEYIKADLKNQAITLVACRGDSAPVKVGGAYEFVGPCVATVANLPFTNIQSRKGPGGALTPNRPISRLIVVPGTSEIKGQTEADIIGTDYEIGYDLSSGTGDVTTSMYNFSTSNPISFDNDIYFIYSYADELV